MLSPLHFSEIQLLFEFRECSTWNYFWNSLEETFGNFFGAVPELQNCSAPLSFRFVRRLKTKKPYHEGLDYACGRLFFLEAIWLFKGACKL